METNDSKGNSFSHDFWIEQKDSKGRNQVTIEQHKLIDFCSKVLGFYNYVDYAGTYHLVRITRKCIVKEVNSIDLKQAIKSYLRDEKKLEQVWTQFTAQNKI